MRRIITAFLLLAAVDFAAFAEGIGIDAGVRVDFSEINLEGGHPLITPSIEYNNSFGDLSVFADAEYGIELGDDVGQGLFLEEALGYDLPLGDASTLSFALDNQNEITIAPEVDTNYANILSGTLEPSVGFTQGLDFGDLYATLGFPIGYAQVEKDADLSFDAYLTLGLAAGFGLGAELTFNFAISPEAQYTETGLLISYETEAFYTELGVAVDSEFAAFTITPEFDYFLNQFTLYAGLELGLGGDDIVLSPFIGAKYSF